MGGSKDLVKAERERAVFELFCRSQNWWSAEARIESRVPPEPDILFTPASGDPVAFEIVEFMDRDFARTMASDRATEDHMRAGFNELPPSKREQLQASFADSDIAISFEYGVTERQRAKAVDALLDHLLALPPGWTGVEIRPSGLRPQVTQLIVQRGPFTGPIFSVASATWVDDPSIEAIEEKVNSTYKTPHPLELLAYIELNPMFPDDAWIPDLADFCRGLASCPFRAIYVFDVTRGEVLFSWPPTAGS